MSVTTSSVRPCASFAMQSIVHGRDHRRIRRVRQGDVLGVAGLDVLPLARVHRPRGQGLERRAA